MALARPPSPPGGGVIWVKSEGRSAAAPSQRSTPMIQSSQKSPKASASVETAIITLFMRLRRR